MENLIFSLRGEVKFLTGGKVFTLFMMDKAVARELCYVTADLVKIQSRRYSPDERRYIIFLGKKHVKHLCFYLKKFKVLAPFNLKDAGIFYYTNKSIGVMYYVN